MPVLLRYPNAGAPTETITLNEVFAQVQPPNAVPFGQNLLVAMSGREYVQEYTSNRQNILTMAIRSLHEDIVNSLDGMIRLRAFHETTLNGMLELFDLTDADGDTYTVRYVSGLGSIRENGGRSQSYKRFSGQLVYRVTI